jgi:hypothetical protein
MSVPEDIHQLITLFYPGSREDAATEEEWIANVVNSFSAKRKEGIRKYLDELLSGQYSDDELGRIWRSVSPSYDFSEGGHRYFLTEIRKALG